MALCLNMCVCTWRWIRQLSCKLGQVDKLAAVVLRSIVDKSIGPGASQRHKVRLPRIRRARCKGRHNVSSDTPYLLGSPCRSCIRYLGRCERRKQSRKSCTFSHEEETFSRDSACFLKLIVCDQKYIPNIIIQAICTWSRTKCYKLFLSTNGENASTNVDHNMTNVCTNM